MVDEFSRKRTKAIRLGGRERVKLAEDVHYVVSRVQDEYRHTNLRDALELSAFEGAIRLLRARGIVVAIKGNNGTRLGTR